jgi:hypothetical protein
MQRAGCRASGGRPQPRTFRSRRAFHTRMTASAAFATDSSYQIVAFAFSGRQRSLSVDEGERGEGAEAGLLLLAGNGGPLTEHRGPAHAVRTSGPVGN